jgi:hypothetical protein
MRSHGGAVVFDRKPVQLALRKALVGLVGADRAAGHHSDLLIALLRLRLAQRLRDRPASDTVSEPQAFRLLAAVASNVRAGPGGGELALRAGAYEGALRSAVSPLACQDRFAVVHRQGGADEVEQGSRV